MNNINSEITDEILFKISNFFNEEIKDFNIDDIEIKIGVGNFKLRKLDEYLFFKHNPRALKSDFQHTPEININIDGLKFNLYEKNEREQLIYRLDEYGNEYQEME